MLLPGLAAADYELGYGYKLSDLLTIGGYISTELKSGQNTKELVVDDVAFLAYGRSNNLSWFVELESVDFYAADYEQDTEEWNTAPAIERLYLDYQFSNTIMVRLGKQITPVGYWNLQPINVLRETTSNPALSNQMFPKFLSGVDIYGYLPFQLETTYHFFSQVSEDIDDEYINIPIDRHIGASLETQVNEKWSAGLALGRFDETAGSEAQYVQANAKYRGERFRFQGELNRSSRQSLGNSHSKRLAAYLQGEMHFTPKHALVSRVEYFRDETLDERDRVFILGYSYRPRFPISFKVEHQWHSDSDDHQLEASFSVLF
jgi:hypothetical protein